MTVKMGGRERDDLFIIDAACVACLNDTRISWTAKGIYTILANFSNERLCLDQLKRYCSDSKKSLRSGIEELVKFGYIRKEQDGQKEVFIINTDESED